VLSSSTFSFSTTSRWLRDVVLGGLLAVVAFELIVSSMGWVGLALPSDYPMARTPNAKFVFPGVYYTFPEFETPVTLNALAFHDMDRSEKPAAGVTRAAVWGDSIFEGYQVERHELTTQRLEKALQKDGQKVEVLNLGYSGGRAATLFSTDALDQIEGLGVDLLLVELHSLMEANHALAGGKPSFLPAGFLGFPERNSNSLKHWLVDKAGLDGLYLLQQRARSIVRQKGEVQAPDFFYRRHDIDAKGRDVAWDRLRDLFKQLKTIETERQMKVVLIYVPAWAEVAAHQQGTVLSLSANRTPLNYDLLRKGMEAMAKEMGFPFVDITPAFHNLDAHTHYASDRHWTPLGHQKAAEQVLPMLRKHLP
jgi:hypothetical protein